ncbi:hypothetical protein I3843_01G026400 [Carya illinoinensis]|nr:hypothetical protein I3843_01G026400 [Carya illinoinensis]
MLSLIDHRPFLSSFFFFFLLFFLLKNTIVFTVDSDFVVVS